MWIATFALLLGTIGSVQAQPYWVKTVASLGNDQVSDVKVDADGEIYITGEFSGSALFAGQTFQSAGSVDLFVAKLHADGTLAWWAQGGGFGIDRGIRLALGTGDRMAVVGEFMGQATFGGTQLTSQAFTPDMFCASLSKSTGAFDWVRQGGGDAGSDRPYGVTISPNGQVTMVGEFKGAATWDGSSLTSTLNPNDQEPSMDVVIASYSANGQLLWLQQGAADFTDRAIDVVSDPLNNLYVAGQFSDTITFDAVHTNAMYNATFLLKLNSAGQEQWFRRCGGGVFDHVRDMLYTPDNALMLVGDVQGTMIFLDDMPDQISSGDPYAYYVMKVDTSGTLLAHSVLGSQNPVSARGVDLRNGGVTVLGQFNCQFTDLSTHYGGTGLFMAAGDQDLFVSKHLASDLSFVEARQFGGPGGKIAGQVATLPDGDVLACGSFTRSISFAGKNTEPITVSFADWSQSVGTPYSAQACPDDYESGWYSQDARGLKDGLLARAYVEDSVVYDFWNRDGSACDHPSIPTMCAMEDYFIYWGGSCGDTLVRCEELVLAASLPFSASFGQWDGVGPLVTAFWSDGDTTLTDTITATGWYSVVVSAVNGCWSWSDSVYVVINPMPPVPLISDDVIVNTNSSNPLLVDICDPDSALIWCSNIDSTTTWYWAIYAQGDTTQPDTAYTASFAADTTLYASFHMVTDAGCEHVTVVGVLDHPTMELGDYGGAFDIFFPQDTEPNDSIWLCQNTSLQYGWSAQWSLNGDTVPLPGALQLFTSVNNGPWTLQIYHDVQFMSTFNYGPGWNNFNVRFKVTNGPCGTDSLIFSHTEQIWIGIWPAVYPSVTLTGPISMCAGDSALIMANCNNCDSVIWSGPSWSANTPLSIWAQASGYYWVSAYRSDVHGCTWAASAYHEISYPPGPLLYSVPTDGIICPNDSALIYTNVPGTDQVWYGPEGVVPNGLTQVWADTPGEYYLTMTDLQGCELTSDPLLLTGYSTPFVDISPDNVLCLVDDEATLSVITTGPSSIVWAAPLSGNALTQTVTQPGTYSVSVSACGIVTQVDVVIIASEVDAQVVDAGPFNICPGDSVQLQGVDGQAAYIWQPGQIYAQNITVTQGGEYTLQVVDGNGCTDVSQAVLVNVHAFAEPLQVVGDTICIGADALLTASGSGTITWYTDATLQQVAFTGATFTLPALLQDTTFHVTQNDGTCISAAQMVTAYVQEFTQTLVITAPAGACLGSAVIISADAPGATEFNWITPTGTAQGSTITINDMSAADVGNYICTASFGACGQAVDTVVLALVTPLPLDLGPDAEICTGATAGFTLPSGFHDPVWSDGSTLPDFDTQNEGHVVLQALDTNGCSAIDSAFVDVLQFTMPLSVLDVTVCAGIDATLTAQGSGTVSWSTSATMDPIVATGGVYVLQQPPTSAMFYLIQQENGCTSEVMDVALTVLPVPTGMSIAAPSYVCVGDTLQVAILGMPDVQVIWSTPTGPDSGSPLLIVPFSEADAGVYTAYTFIGICAGDTPSTEVEHRDPQPFSLGPDTSFCTGGTFTLQVPSTFADPVWSTGDQGFLLSVSEAGIYGATALDIHECVVSDDVVISTEDCDPVVPNIITPNNDGVNDVWRITNAGFLTAHLTVWDRFGSQVYDNDPVQHPFKGVNDRNGEPLSAGVYYYVLRMERSDHTIREQKGYLQLSR
jgi:gliding motility-associated-like protein